MSEIAPFAGWPGFGMAHRYGQPTSSTPESDVVDAKYSVEARLYYAIRRCERFPW